MVRYMCIGVQKEQDRCGSELGARIKLYTATARNGACDCTSATGEATGVISGMSVKDENLGSMRGIGEESGDCCGEFGGFVVGGDYDRESWRWLIRKKGEEVGEEGEEHRGGRCRGLEGLSIDEGDWKRLAA